MVTPSSPAEATILPPFSEVRLLTHDVSEPSTLTPAPAAARSRIVLAAGDGQLRRKLTAAFESSAYVVEEVSNASEALPALAVAAAELVVLVASGDGLEEILVSLREATSAPLVVLTATPGDDAVAQALDAGADDAMAPPYAATELLARLRLALRKARPSGTRTVHRLGELTLDRESRELRVAGRQVTLTRLEYRLLEELMLGAGRPVQHDELLARVWGPAHRGRLNYLRVYVARLRAKIEESPSVPQLIVSVPGVGYRVGGYVESASAPASTLPMDQASSMGAVAAR
jgi:two-component system KDP operon response regulator KdpE